MSGTWSRARDAVAGLSALVFLTACGVDDATLTGSAGSVRSAVVVGSGETIAGGILAEIYAGAIRSTGAAASTVAGQGDRARYLEQLDSGAVTLVPEFTGALLAFYVPESSVTDPDEVFESLSGALPQGLSISDFGAAEDRSVLVVTEETADRLGVRDVEDLADRCGALVAGFGPGFRRNSAGSRGLGEVGCTFSERREVSEEAAAVRELSEGAVQVVGLGTASPDLIGSALVVLADDTHVFPAQNVVPLFRQGALGEAQIKALNIVAGELTTADLAEMIGQVRGGESSSGDVARAWLDVHL